MDIQVCGVNHRTAPLAVREKLCVPPGQLARALRAMTGRTSVRETVLISTCNRVELYAVPEAGAGRGDLPRLLCEFHGLDPSSLRRYFYHFSGLDAVEHLYRVVTSLDSMVLGETQIFGQVKRAYEEARREGCVGRVLRRIFAGAIKVGREARSRTAIGRGAVSISSLSVGLARSVLGDLRGKKVMIVGAGKIGELTLKHLEDEGVGAIHVVNRTHARARELASRIGGTAVPLGRMGAQMRHVDMVISSTGALPDCQTLLL